MRIIIPVLILCFCACTSRKKSPENPKLIIGIVVDQMRYDYLERFKNDFGADGFNKLLKEGFTCDSVNYNYKPTYTGPGHATIFTGVDPSVHGIVGNNWFSRVEDQVVYCASVLDNNGEVLYSPERLLTETFADQLKTYFNGKSKTYGISLKDRGAILPSGLSADGAFWFNGKTGKWNSSEYYKNPSPNYLEEFNKEDFKDKYLSNGWNLSLAMDAYSESFPDSTNFEGSFTDSTPSIFPYDLVSIFKEKSWGLLKAIPQGNQMTADLAQEVIQTEKLGTDEFTDFLSISFSATDYVGHQFGTQSMEVHDTYLKLDETLASLIHYLDTTIGKENVLLFLTSDHGASVPRNYLKEKALDGGLINTRKIKKGLEESLDQKFGKADWLRSLINLNVYFTDSVKKSSSIDSEGYAKWVKIKSFAIQYLEHIEGIVSVVDVESFEPKTNIEFKVKRGIVDDLSGDLILIEKPNWTSYSNKGSTHGSPYAYDTHVPLLFYGKNVKAGKSSISHSIVDIMPTVSVLSGIPFRSSDTVNHIQGIQR